MSRRFSCVSPACDAACVGLIETLEGWRCPTLAIKATGRGTYQRTRLDCFGFPRGYLTRQKRIYAFPTGDHVRANVPSSKHKGVHVGRVAVRATGNFNIRTGNGLVQGLSHRHCQVLQRADGYGYSFNSTPAEEARQGA